MKRLLALALAVFAAAQANGQGSATACYLGASFTTCFKPVVHTSMEGPAAPTVSGYLSSGDWATFNGKGTGTVTSVTGTAPVVSSGGTTPAISMPVATVTANGYLASADWAVFNNRVATTRTISTTSPLTGGGALSANLTLAIPAGTVTANGYLASGDWATFNGKGGAYTQGNLTEATSAVLTIGSGTGAVFGSGTTIQVAQSSLTGSGYLSSTDWSQFNSRVATTRSIATTSPLTGGGDLSANRTFAIPQANVTTNGYLASADWAIFNGRQAAGSYALQATAISTTSPLAGGGDLSTTRTLSIPAATATVNGYLASGDWATFNGKGTGTVTSVTGTAPVVSSGGTTPAISMPVATVTANGYLASADWASFNSRGGVATVTGTAPVVSSGGSSPAISMPVATLTANGYLASSDWAVFNNQRVALAGSTLTGVIDGSASTAGFDVEQSRSSPNKSDSQNVYSGTYTPTLTRTGDSFTAQTFYWYRDGAHVTVSGYAVSGGGGGTNITTITLPIAPTAFTTGNAARSQCNGIVAIDTAAAIQVYATASSTTTCDIQSIGNAAEGMSIHFQYRL